MDVLVVGGSGFIGTALSERLLADGHRVTSLDVTPQDDGGHERLRTATVDVTDEDALREAFARADPAAVVNLAYLLGAESDADPAAALQVNCVGMDNVLRAAGETGVGRVVYASSVSVYGTPDNYDGPVTEDTEPPAAYTDYPSMFYNATNQLNEYQGRLYADEYGYEAVAIRPSMVFGPGRGGGLNAWIANFVRKPAAGETGHIPYLPERQLCLVYVDDAAAIFAAAATTETVDHEAYNTGGITLPAAEVADIVGDELPGTVTCAGDPSEELSPLIVTSETDDRMRAEFDIELTPLREGIRAYAAALGESQ